MNTPIRRLAVLVFAMFATLLIATTWIQFVQADELRDRPNNRRTLVENYSQDRGPILADTTTVAQSEATDDQLQFVRTYPAGRLYSHITGYYSFTYGANGGLERSRNGLLSGTDDSLFYKRIVDMVTGTPPQGAALELTVDPKVQEAAENALGERRGAVVALDPGTGAILALVSHPSYDPNELSSHNLSEVDAAFERLGEDPAQPLVNRAIEGDLYPPGSVFKLVVAAAALESGEYTASSTLEGPQTYTLPGTTIELPNFEGGRCVSSDQISLADSIRVSCNTSLAWLAGQLGAGSVREQAEQFGYSQSVEIPMPVTPSVYPAQVSAAELALTGIGQHEVRVTPMQVAMTTAAIANDGQQMNPFLVESARDSDLDVIDETDPRPFANPISSETARALRDMMVEVVDDGSGAAAAIPGVEVAGKTGTAEFGSEGAAHAWFTGFAPADDPQIAMAVIVESASGSWSGQSGGTVAAPIGRTVLEAGIGDE
ncbi:MAG TPA: penicillin-binding protein 2 [Ornithinimicrobium sp.]|uniref:peptidoglycan D,D-transpeptidase FtsI family protein n=1 Tax=Ornithinimicrobium sp. TaxID=1977084 RepID=UPI002B45CD28|nr:penicillin-binding protein 2 [Ornithinimicrobium sp.]HKJ12761.1 penicillin-binding protein 2 [Ornithinimicrobium sp.]